MCPHLSQVLQGDPSLHFPDSLLRPPLVRAVLLLPLHQNKALRNYPAARDEAVGGRRQMAGTEVQMQTAGVWKFLDLPRDLSPSAPCLL